MTANANPMMSDTVGEMSQLSKSELIATYSVNGESLELDEFGSPYSLYIRENVIAVKFTAPGAYHLLLYLYCSNLLWYIS